MKSFSRRLLAWHADHGRHDLPWQLPRTPYRVWVSEVMLQQTQVATVIPYFERWMRRFPDIPALAAASMDEVLSCWAGLGYYARGRNLHAAAVLMTENHDSQLPRDLDDLMSLPGIGRSTAGAILAQAHGQRVPILDGNVKRVFARHAAVAGWPGRRAVEKKLWRIAEARLPARRVADYTQAIMDLGATLCVQRKPKCESCPVHADCVARKQGNQHIYPGKPARISRPLKHTRMLLAKNRQGEILLQRRPPAGIWGGLWCLPEIPREILETAAFTEYCRELAGASPAHVVTLPSVRHGFTHFELEIIPVAVELEENGSGGQSVMDAPESLWYKPEDNQAPGLPAPVTKLIGSL